MRTRENERVRGILISLWIRIYASETYLSIRGFRDTTRFSLSLFSRVARIARIILILDKRNGYIEYMSYYLYLRVSTFIRFDKYVRFRFVRVNVRFIKKKRNFSMSFVLFIDDISN